MENKHTPEKATDQRRSQKNNKIFWRKWKHNVPKLRDRTKAGLREMFITIKPTLRKRAQKPKFVLQGTRPKKY